MNRARWNGFTLIEMLVVMAIIATLTGLILPAIQAARESSRRSNCQSNLKQLALAAYAYHEQHFVFPAGRDFYWNPSTMSGQTGQFSVHCRILPFLDHQAIYDQIDWTDQQATTLRIRTFTIREFLCPSDTVERMRGPNPLDAAGEGRNNYKANGGSDLGRLMPLAPSNGVSPKEFNNGIFLCNLQVSMGMVRDGASTTAMFSEARRGDGDDNEVTVPGDWFVVDEAAVAATADAVYAACYAFDPKTKLGAYQVSRSGRGWVMGNYVPTRYNHVAPPNGRSCIRWDQLGVSADGASNGMDHGSATTASSFHGGGVNLAFVDGHVRFLADGVDLTVWRGIGSRDGGEIFDPNF